MICKECGRDFEYVEGLLYCPGCGSKIEVEQYDCAWERRDKYGFADALYLTWKQSIFDPANFFKRVPPEGGISSAFLYAMIIGMIGVCFNIFWEFIFRFAGIRSWIRNEQFEYFEKSWFLLLMLVISPILITLALFVGAGIYHMLLWILRGANRGYEATFKALSYSYGPNIFIVIPFCGGLIAGLWSIVLMVIGLRELHKTTTAKALIAVLLPFIICCGLGVVIAIIGFTSIYRYM